MSKKLYIAYGSNLNLKQMKYRCPTAKLVGKGVVENYELQFKGMPHCSYATIAPCSGKSVPVALWELQPRDEKLLDRYEGYPSHYFKQDLPVKLNNGSEQTAMVYIMNLNTFFMVSLIIQQLYREILSVADENGGVLKNRCVFFCDEFGSATRS